MKDPRRVLFNSAYSEGTKRQGKTKTVLDVETMAL